jgi:hypothetical protein
VRDYETAEQWLCGRMGGLCVFIIGGWHETWDVIIEGLFWRAGGDPGISRQPMECRNAGIKSLERVAGAGGLRCKLATRFSRMLPAQALELSI